MEDFSKDLAVINGIPAVPTILDVVCRTTGMGFAAVARVTEDRWIACSLLDHIHFGLKPGGELPVETTICHEICQTRDPVVIEHVSEDACYRDHHTPRLYGFQSYISMPIILKSGKFFGTLCAIDPNPAKLNTPEVIGMFRMFADLIAFQIDAAGKLADSESELVTERETSVLREQFIAVLGHDLRNPLGAITMSAALLKETPLDERSAALVGVVEQSAARMGGLIEDVMDFARGRLGGGIPLDKRCDLRLQPILEQVINEMRAVFPGRGITAEFAISEAVSYDARRVTQLFTNLLENSMKHGRPGEPVIVRVTSAGGRFELSVSNSADPIPEAVRSRLFEPFSRGDAENYQQGLGLGLYIASQIAKSHGGTLELISMPEETRFTFAMNGDGA